VDVISHDARFYHVRTVPPSLDLYEPTQERGYLDIDQREPCEGCPRGVNVDPYRHSALQNVERSGTAGQEMVPDHAGRV